MEDNRAFIPNDYYLLERGKSIPPALVKFIAYNDDVYVSTVLIQFDSTKELHWVGVNKLHFK